MLIPVKETLEINDINALHIVQGIFIATGIGGLTAVMSADVAHTEKERNI